jgi:hypothetical protein
MADRMMSCIDGSGMNGVDRAWCVRVLKENNNNLREAWERYEEREALAV